MRKKITLQTLFVLLTVCAVVVLASDISFAARRNKKKKIKWVKSKYGLKALIQMSKDRGKMVKEYKQETENYEKVAKALESGDLNDGINSDDVLKKYGAPVIALPTDNESVEQWIYKPGIKSYFEGPKIYLYFGDNKQLLKVEEIDGK